MFGYKTNFNFSSKVYNKNLLNLINLVRYFIISTIYHISTVFVYPFQRKFINIYTVLLQLNRLPFRVIPTNIKSFFIYIVDMESWILFFKRIKNNQNLYIIRQKNSPIIHRLWVLYFRNKTIYYPELNIKRARSDEIANFYYFTRMHDTSGKIVPSSYKLVLFYFLNKIVLNNYPHLYWTYILTYFKYNYSTNAVTTSQHVRTHIMYIFINQIDKFSKSDLYYSFLKLDFSTFKSIKRTLHYINTKKKIVFTPLKGVARDTILTPFETNIKIFDKHFFKKYINFYKTTKTYKFYINELISKNYINVQRLNNTLFLNIPFFLKINWYNKLHNTTHNIIKNTLIMYIRAAKHFNKGRYSRNRQLYRTGVYWCIWLNVVIVYALHFYFYRVVFSFGYLWLPLGLMILTIFSSRLYKYRYYSVPQLVLEFKEYSNFLFWFYLKFQNVYVFKIKELCNTCYNFFKNYLWLLYKFFEGKICNIKLFFGKIF